MAYKPGQSGNSTGRPKGAVGLPGKLREKLAKEADAIIDKLIDEAKAGNVQAGKIILDKCLPNLRPSADLIHLQLAPGQDLAKTGQVILDAATSGQIAPDAAAMLSTCLASQAKLIESTDLLKRIEALEKQYG